MNEHTTYIVKSNLLPSNFPTLAETVAREEFAILRERVLTESGFVSLSANGQIIDHAQTPGYGRDPGPPVPLRWHPETAEAPPSEERPPRAVQWGGRVRTDRRAR